MLQMKIVQWKRSGQIISVLAAGNSGVALPLDTYIIQRGLTDCLFFCNRQS